MALIGPMFKKSAWVVGNEDREFHSGPGAANGGTEHSLRHEAEAQYKKTGRSGTAEKDGGDSCAAERGAGESGTPVKICS